MELEKKKLVEKIQSQVKRSLKARRADSWELGHLLCEYRDLPSHKEAPGATSIKETCNLDLDPSYIRDQYEGAQCARSAGLGNTYQDADWAPKMFAYALRWAEGDAHNAVAEIERLRAMAKGLRPNMLDHFKASRLNGVQRSNEAQAIEVVKAVAALPKAALTEALSNHKEARELVDEISVDLDVRDTAENERTQRTISNPLRGFARYQSRAATAVGAIDDMARALIDDPSVDKDRARDLLKKIHKKVEALEMALDTSNTQSLEEELAALVAEV